MEQVATRAQLPSTLPARTKHGVPQQASREASRQTAQLGGFHHNQRLRNVQIRRCARVKAMGREVPNLSPIQFATAGGGMSNRRRPAAPPPKLASAPTEFAAAHRDSSFWCPDTRTGALFLALIRLYSAVSLPISDCDETFNYWEPAHYLLYGRGFQTWEYRCACVRACVCWARSHACSLACTPAALFRAAHSTRCAPICTCTSML